MVSLWSVTTKVPEVGVDEPLSCPSPASRCSEGLFRQLQLSGDIRPFRSGHGSGGPLAQQRDLVLVGLSEEISPSRGLCWIPLA